MCLSLLFMTCKQNFIVKRFHYVFVITLLYILLSTCFRVGGIAVIQCKERTVPCYAQVQGESRRRCGMYLYLEVPSFLTNKHTSSLVCLSVKILASGF